MEDEWAEVKQKKKKAPPPKNQTQGGIGTGAQGGKSAKGMLMPGAVAQKGKYGGNSTFKFGNSLASHSAANSMSAAAAADDFYEGKVISNNQASAIADFDFGVDEGGDSHTEVEMISHTCAASIRNARLQADMTQA